MLTRKVKLLIHEVVVCEVWKEKVLPLIKYRLVNQGGLKNYISVASGNRQIFHESVLMNLLETICFHRTAVDAADDYLLEIGDYCYRAIHKLVAGKTKYQEAPKTAEGLSNQTPESEFDRQMSVIHFNIAMSSISLLRYITDYIKYIPLSVIRHLHLENDMLMSCIALIEERPWLRKNENDGEREKYEDSQWVKVKKNEMYKLPKIEGQIWIMIYNLVLSPECAKSYEITDYRKNMLLRVTNF
jgi:hypothetical protein